MKLPVWANDIDWLQSISQPGSLGCLFRRYMLPNILKYEVECKYLITHKVNPYFAKLDEYERVSIVANLLTWVDLYDGEKVREKIKNARLLANQSAVIADDLAKKLAEIKRLEDSIVFAIPKSLESLLEMQNYFLIPLESSVSCDSVPDKKPGTQVFIENMAHDLRTIPIGVPGFEFLDNYQTRCDPIALVTQVFKLDLDPPDSVIGAFVLLCFGKQVEESTVQKQNSPSRKKSFRKFSDIMRIKNSR